MKFKIIFLLFLSIIILTGCTSKEANVYLYITGYEISPSDIVTVGEPVKILLTISASSISGVYELYHWQVTDYDDEFVTSANGLSNLKFETPGKKNILVYVTSNYPFCKSNVYTITIEVLPSMG